MMVVVLMACGDCRGGGEEEDAAKDEDSDDDDDDAWFNVPTMINAQWTRFTDWRKEYSRKKKKETVSESKGRDFGPFVERAEFWLASVQNSIASARVPLSGLWRQ